eukprot:m.8436 g.8436  ORF g.8436 m.8436 type:complete len:189 (+) comp6373_c0_seq1:3-569(+)
MDGRKFVQHVMDAFAQQAAGTAPAHAANLVASASRPQCFDHAVMNLPASATEFLDAFRGILWHVRDTMSPEQLPMIHCYCFSKAEDLAKDGVRLCEEGLGGPLDAPYSVHEVRDVAPKKRMLCVSFRLPARIAFMSREEVAQMASTTAPTGDISDGASKGTASSDEKNADTIDASARPTKRTRLDTDS